MLSVGWLRYRTWGRPYQSLWELRVLVNAGPINLLLGEIFSLAQVDALELCFAQVGFPGEMEKFLALGVDLLT